MNPVLLNVDLWVEYFSLFIAFFIAAFSFYAYFLTKQKRHEAFGLGFLLLSVGIFFSALFNSYVEFENLTVPVRGYLPVLFYLGIILTLSMLFTVAGYLTVFMVTEQLCNKKAIFLLYLFALFTALISHEIYWAYHIVLLILIAFIFAHFYKNYQERANKTSFLVMISFACMFIAHVTLSLIVFSYTFYFVGVLLRLVSFILLLLALVMIYKRK